LRACDTWWLLHCAWVGLPTVALIAALIILGGWLTTRRQ
jgi:hypothetical protein